MRPAVADGVDPVLVDQLLLDEVEEEGVADHPVLVAGAEAEAAVEGFAVFVAGDVALLVHRVQHLVAALQRGVGSRKGLYSEGACGSPAISADSVRLELLGGLAEVGLRRRLDPDRGLAFDRAVGRRVEVGGEDPLLGVGFLLS